jgi:hypothetical protein
MPITHGVETKNSIKTPQKSQFKPVFKRMNLILNDNQTVMFKKCYFATERRQLLISKYF